MSHFTSISTYGEVLADFTPRSSRINYDPTAEIIGEYQKSADILVQTFGLSEFSVIISLLDSNNNEVNWNNQHYTIFVSDTAGNSQPSDPYDYYHQIVPDPDRWIRLRDVSCGTDVRVTNSFNNSNSGTFASPIHFKWVRFSIDEIPNHKIKMIYSGR
jgi:hypothetical protein